MENKTCHIILVGFYKGKFELTIDKLYSDKLIIVSGKEEQSGSKKAHKLSAELKEEYENRGIIVEEERINYLEGAKAVAQITYMILQQRIEGFKKVFINVSGGLRYIDIWFYIAGQITDTDVIHGDYIYNDEDRIVNIRENMNLTRLPIVGLTIKQFEFLKLFFHEFKDIKDFIKPAQSYDESKLLNYTKKHNSIDEIRVEYEKMKGIEKISRGTINSYIQLLKEMAALKTTPNPENKKKMVLEISYFGIAFFLNFLYNQD